MFVLQNFSVFREGKDIIHGVNFSFSQGTTNFLLGKNGAGKSSLALALMGHPAYTMKGHAFLYGVDLLTLSPDNRSKQGLFLLFQNPQEIPGVSIIPFLYEMCRTHGQLYDSLDHFKEYLFFYTKLLKLDQSLLYRELNYGFSGGEKKRFELLQLLLLRPKFAILDEPDSGLDVDALRLLIDGVKFMKQQVPDMIILIITHYKQLLVEFCPDAVHVMNNGTIEKSGSYELGIEIFKNGYNEDFL